MSTGPLSLHEVVVIALGVLEGLTQLHAADILHLDLKPGNILLDEYGPAYVADFGISYALRTMEACTPCTGISGTPHYMYAHQPCQFIQVTELTVHCQQLVSP